MTATDHLNTHIGVIGGNAQPKLRDLVARVERLNEDKRAVTEDIKELFAEIKAEGFDPKIVRAVIKLRAQDAAKVSETQALIDLYLSALGA